MLFDAETDPHNASSTRAQHSCFNLVCINTGTMCAMCSLDMGPLDTAPFATQHPYAPGSFNSLPQRLSGC